MLEIGPFQNHRLQVIERHLSHPPQSIDKNGKAHGIVGRCGDLDVILSVWSWKQEAGSFYDFAIKKVISKSYTTNVMIVMTKWKIAISVWYIIDRNKTNTRVDLNSFLWGQPSSGIRNIYLPNFSSIYVCLLQHISSECLCNLLPTLWHNYFCPNLSLEAIRATFAPRNDWEQCECSPNRGVNEKPGCSEGFFWGGTSMWIFPKIMAPRYFIQFFTIFPLQIDEPGVPPFSETPIWD